MSLSAWAPDVSSACVHSPSMAAAGGKANSSAHSQQVFPKRGHAPFFTLGTQGLAASACKEREEAQFSGGRLQYTSHRLAENLRLSDRRRVLGITGFMELSHLKTCSCKGFLGQVSNHKGSVILTARYCMPGPSYSKCMGKVHGWFCKS